MRTAAAATIACMLLTGCGSANATVVDPASDVHCSVIAFYFHGLARHDSAPLDQQKATKAVHDWYSAKIESVSTEWRRDMARAEREISPVLDAIKADPRAMLDEMMACTKRAAADPGFNAHAYAYR